MKKYSILEHFLFPPTLLDEQKLEQVLNGKTILITGASSGIGEQLAYRLAKYSVHLILVARREERLQAIKEHIEQQGARVSIVRIDLRNEEELSGLLAFLRELPNGIDIFVNNAGHSIRRSLIHSLDRFHDFTRTMCLHYYAPVRLLLELIPMLQRNHGQIINVSTINALLPPFPAWAAYQASKTAFDVWLRASEYELNQLGIATSSLYLPLVDTPMITPTRVYQSLPSMAPEHVAKIICKMMFTRKRKYQPWWIRFARFTYILFPRLWEIILRRSVTKGGREK